MKRSIGPVLLISALAAIVPVPSQSLQQPARLTFEVASIKPLAPGGPRFMTMPPGGRFASTTSAWSLIGFAFNVRDYQISGGSDWLKDELWEIQAIASSEPLPADSPLLESGAPQRMLQSLLEDRFAFRYRYETKVFPAYELRILRSGLRVLPSEDQTPNETPTTFSGGSLPRGAIRSSRGQIKGVGVRIADLRTMLASMLNMEVVDSTNLTGLYDFDLSWTPDMVASVDSPPTDPNAVSIFTALKEQLGLELVSVRLPQKKLVIESIRRPDLN